MHYKRTFSYFIFFLLLLSSCRQSQDLNPTLERDEILRLHHLQKKFHFEKMVDEFVDLLSENHISVNRGEIKKPSRQDHTTRFTRYFESVEFEKWDDIEPPVIRFSDDYSMAYTIVDKEVVVRYMNEDGNEVRELTKFSWVAIYKKYGEDWKVDCVASTNQPSIAELIDEH